MNWVWISSSIILQTVGSFIYFKQFIHIVIYFIMLSFIQYWALWGSILEIKSLFLKTACILLLPLKDIYS